MVNWFNGKMIKIKFLSRISYILIIFVLIATGFYPVFAFEMKSRNYHLELEYSDIQPIPQDFNNEFKKNTNNDGTIANFLSNNNYKLLKAGAIVAILFFLTIWIFRRTKNKPHNV